MKFLSEMKSRILFVLLMLVLFASCSENEDMGGQTAVDNRLPAAEVISLVKSGLFDEEGNPIGVAYGENESVRKVCASNALEAIMLYSSTHDGIEFLLPYDESQDFHYQYTLRDNRGSMEIKKSDEAGYYAEMTLRIPECPEISRILFMNREAFWNEANSSSSQITDLSTVDLGPSASIQFLFQKLQLEIAQTVSNKAKEYLEQIENTQKEQATVAYMINACRELQHKANESGTYTKMPDDIRMFMDTNNLQYDKTGNDFLMTAAEWDVALKSLTDYQETIGNDTQTYMVYLQDFIGQYNSYLQGVNAGLTASNETLASLLRK